MDKVHVNGEETHEVFKYLRGNSKELISKRDPNKMLKIPWNFCKWIVDKNGKVEQYLNPTIQLHTCYELIEFLLDPTNQQNGKKKGPRQSSMRDLKVREEQNILAQILNEKVD